MISASQQFGALHERSAVNLTIYITLDVNRDLNEGFTETLLALDAVLPGRLARRLREQGWPESFVPWKSSFAIGRSVQIRLDGKTSPLQQVNCELTHDLPLPLSFLYYISHQHLEWKIKLKDLDMQMTSH